MMNQDLRNLISQAFPESAAKRGIAESFFQEEMVESIAEARSIRASDWDRLKAGISGPLCAALGLNQALPSSSAAVTASSYATMKLPDLLAALANGDREPKLLTELRAQGIDAILLDAQGSLAINETIKALSEPMKPVIGQVWGRDRLRVVSLAEYTGRIVECEPISLHPLDESGMDNVTGIDWKPVPKNLRLFLRYLFRSGTPRDPHDVMEDLMRARFQLEELSKQPRYQRAFQQYTTDQDRDLTLTATLTASLYRLPGTRDSFGSRGSVALLEFADSSLPRDWNPGRVRLLHDIMTKLYANSASARIAASDAGLNTGRIDFSGSAVAIWHSILTEAEKSRDGLNRVLRHARAEYPDNSALCSI